MPNGLITLKCFLFGFAFMLLTCTAAAQHYNVRKFSSDQGLPESKINALCEDRRGNLWIATEGAGLIRFDGYTFDRYAKEDGLINNNVTSIIEDHAGKLWIGTASGLCTYDGLRFQIVPELQNQTVTSILQDDKNHFLFGTLAGLFTYDGKAFQPFYGQRKEQITDINCLFLDNRASLWIGTAHGILSVSNDQVQSFTTKDGLPSNIVRGIVTCSDSTFWIATSAGVCKFNGTTFTSYPTLNSLRSNDVYCLRNDGKNNLWIGTAAGALKYNGRSFQNTEVNEGHNSDVTCMYRDSEGNLWFGSSENGLSKMDSERFIHYPENDNLGKNVYSIIQAINGNIICGTSLGGTTVFDGSHYTRMDKEDGFTSSIVQSLYYAPRDSSLWVGTENQGLFIFDKSAVRQFSTDDGFVSNTITGLVADDANRMWVATANHGVSVLQADYDSLRILQNYTTDNGLVSNAITCIAYDQHVIWLGTEDQGLITITISDNGPKGDTIAYTYRHYTTADGVAGGTINTIITDTLHHVYIGTNEGIAIFHDNRFTNITKANGLGSNNIYSLVLDHSNNLWAGTDRGVDMITFGTNPSLSTIRHFVETDGFKGQEVNRGSSCVDREGSIWFGTVNGLVKYNPREEVEAKITPSTHLTGVKLFFDDMQNTPYADSLSAWYSMPQHLALPYNQNNLTFSFVGVHQRNPEAVRYRWFLEGFSKNWSPPIQERSVTFSNLYPGTYTFKVIACNEFNIWNDVPAEFTFVINPPFWQQWWARIAGAIILIGFVWIIFQLRLGRIKAKNKIIHERLEMEKNILELEQEAARLQMNPHFIFNCLNSIQGFIAVNDPFQAKKYLAKFAKLMRLILENAREEFIPLQNEILILENFLALERLSTSTKFDFAITTDPSIDPEKIQIPPMLIQPFVENAILHGLRRKEEKGTITVHFKIEGNLLICILEDNGIGRKKSGEINETFRVNHKSTGIAVTKRRLEQYGLHRHVKAGIEFVDLQQGENATGTRVIIASPFEGVL